MIDVTWRPLSGDDLGRLHELIRASEVDDGVPWATSEAETNRQLTDPESELAADSIAAVLPDGRLAGFGAVRMRAEARRRRAVGQDGTVHPRYRRRGLGTRIFDWTEERGRRRAATISDGVPAFLEAWANEEWQDRRILFSGRGYEPIRYYDDMRRSLADPIPEAPLPDGLRFVRWSPERDEEFRDAHNDAFADHWGSEPLAAEIWRHRMSGSEHFRGDLTYGVYEGQRLIGYCTAYHAPEDAAVTGRREGWLGQIGVRRAWRGRGVASAVMSHVMQAMIDAGMDDALLDVDSENPSGAVGLYERLGFRRQHRWVRWAKPVSADGVSAEQSG